MNKVANQLRIAAAEARAEEARERMLGTARELAQAVAPKTIARNAWEGAKVKGADLAEDAVDAVRRRPVAATGVVAAITLFLAREPIRQGIVKLYDAMTSDEEEDADDAPPARRSSKKVEKK
jgi:hypothetical protein